ncbi:MAG: MarR family transcriptional regulator [Microthrixaceae bacterium]|nr:MarR family transcriptional regulator [Microthrixaceae bacterium]
MQAWMALVRLLVRLPSALDAQLRRDASITHFEYQVLAQLSMAEGHTMRMSDLAQLADGSLSRLSHTATRLEKRGWISRATDPEDGRYTIATLTKSGMTKMVATAPGHVAAVREHVFEPLTTRQVQQLAAIANRIVGSIDSDTGPA